MDNGGGFMHWVSSSSSSPSYTHQMVDPTVLKLGKRQYYTAAAAAAGEGVGSGAGGGVKRAAPSNGAVIPRCQVEGCGKSLADAKDYHRRHKVCQVHAKAPNVVVLGTEQRFCQQCSRFHAISEFDDSKRSCRRRLAGHNERRRKSNSSSSDSSAASRSTIGLETAVMGGRFPYISAETSPGRALSLLSSSSPALSSQSNAALRELIAENRSALLARQLFSSNGMWRNHVGGYNSNQYVNMISFASHQNQEVGGQCPSLHFGGGWHRFQESGNDHLTLDLMQNAAPHCASFEFDLSGRNKSEEEEECCEIWKSLQGTHVV